MTRLLSLAKVAERLDVSTKTVRRWLAAGEFPAATHALPKGQLRWDELTVEFWIRSRNSPQAEGA